MKTVETKDEFGAVLWRQEVPNVGWVIEDGKLIELSGEQAFRHTRSPETSSIVVYWDRGLAVEHFNLIYEADAAVETPIV